MTKEVSIFAKGGLPVDPKSLASSFQTAVAEKPSIGGLPLLRLVDGEWVYGPENTIVQDESRWAIHPGSFEHGYVSWNDGSMVGEEMRPIAQPRPLQSDLPVTGAKWQEQVSFVLACTSGEDKGTQVLYKSSSLGGRDAWSATAQRILNQLSVDQEKIVPVVELKVTDYRHKKYGKIYVPVFDVVAWAGMGGEVEEKPAKEEKKPAGRRRVV